MQLKLNLFSKFIVLIISVFIYSSVMAYEEPKYTVIKTNDIYEIRYYNDRLAVQTSYNSDGGSGFTKLFNYISGSNKKSSKIKMTTPVTESEKIAMTIPVTQIEENKQMIMQFYLPSNYTIDNVPIPIDPKVEIVNVKEGYFAVIKYSGRPNKMNFEKYNKKLKEKLVEDKIEIISNPIKAIYNGPFTLPILRRNEAIFKIKFKK